MIIFVYILSQKDVKFPGNCYSETICMEFQGLFPGKVRKVSQNVVCWMTCMLNDTNNKHTLALVLLNPDMHFFCNSVDPDQVAHGEANWFESALFYH